MECQPPTVFGSLLSLSRPLNNSKFLFLAQEHIFEFRVGICRVGAPADHIILRNVHVSPCYRLFLCIFIQLILLRRLQSQKCRIEADPYDGHGSGAWNKMTDGGEIEQQRCHET